MQSPRIVLNEVIKVGLSDLVKKYSIRYCLVDSILDCSITEKLEKIHLEGVVVRCEKWGRDARTRPSIATVRRNLSTLVKDRPGTKDERAALIGRPLELEAMAHFLTDVGNFPLVVVTIPVVSYFARLPFWHAGLNVIAFDSLVVPAVALRDVWLCPAGDFPTIFLKHPCFPEKALRASLLAMSYVFGSFHRIVAAGALSCRLAKGLSPFSPPDREKNESLLILVDRTVDVPGILRLSDSYASRLEDCGICFAGLPVDKDALGHFASIQAGPEKLFSEEDEIWMNAGHLSISQKAQILVEGADEVVRGDHGRILDALEQRRESDSAGILRRLWMGSPVKRPEVESALGVQGTLGADFLLLSALVALRRGEAGDVAKVIAGRHGVPSFSKWARLEPFLERSCDLADLLRRLFDFSRGFPKPKLKDVPMELLGTPFSGEPGLRCVLYIIGGVSSGELAGLRSVLRDCLKGVMGDDTSLTIVATSVTTPRDFIRAALV